MRIEYEVLDQIRESADAYIAGTDRAYIATDAVWYAVASVKDLQDAIDVEVLEDARHDNSGIV